MKGQMTIAGWNKQMDTGEKMLECSECESRVFWKEYKKAVGRYGFRYCPYCGAEMINAGQISKEAKG